MRAKHLNILSLEDHDLMVEYVVKDISDLKTITVYKDPANGIPHLSATQKTNLLHRNIRLNMSYSFYVNIVGGIGDTVYAIELILKLKQLMEMNNLACEFFIELPRVRSLQFSQLLKNLELDTHVLISECLTSDTEFLFKFFPVFLDASPNPYRADQYSLMDVRDFLWAKWGIPGSPKDIVISSTINRYRTKLVRKKEELTYSFIPRNKYIIIAPAGSDEKIFEYKSWPLERWIALTQKVISETNLEIMILDNEELGTEFKDEKRVHFFETKKYPVDGVEMLSSLIANCVSGICIDSGPAHLFGLLEKQAIVIWGPTSPLIYAHDNNYNIRLSSCPPCSASSRIQFCIDKICMKDISIEIIWSVLKKSINE